MSDICCLFKWLTEARKEIMICELLIVTHSGSEMPQVVILDNLHHAGALGDIFNGFIKYQKCPYIIGTMNQATCSSTNLQLHHNFR